MNITLRASQFSASSLKLLRTMFRLLWPLLLVLAAGDLLARAGGAGGSSGGGGGGGGGGDAGAIFQIIYVIFMLIPFPFNFIVAGIIIFFYIKMQKTKSVYNKVPENLPTTDTSKSNGFKKFIEANPDFNQNEFLEKVKSSFINVQTAWSAGDISPVRRYISDGVYQRFYTQMQMMKLLKQKNELDDIKIINATVDQFEHSGEYDTIHVAIQASIKDKFTSELDSSLNSGGKEEFIEYWSYIRKRGESKNSEKTDNDEYIDMYKSNRCPSCAAGLPDDMGELSKCEYCGALTNSGEYDWVLAEITQSLDYTFNRSSGKKREALERKVETLYSKLPDFSVQSIEDKVSNGYLQILTAIAHREPARMKRFTSNELYLRLSQSIGEKTIAYNRIFLNDVTLVGTQEKETSHVVMVRIKSTYQRITVGDKNIEMLDPAMTTKSEVVFLELAKQSETQKGSLYAHVCPSCAAPIEDSLDIKCGYCAVELNAGVFDWVITDIMDTQAYQAYYVAHKSEFAEANNIEDFDKNVKVRDYAFNNVMMVIAADGKIEESELTFARSLAKRWGYSGKKIEGFIKMSQTGQLSLRMPDEEKPRRKIIALMEKAAKLDDDYSQAEKLFIDSVKQAYLKKAS
ncbi:MAG: Tim44-like domain-containing protein [Leptospirales bacterium]